MRIPVVQAKDLKSSDEFMQLCAPISDFSYRLPVLIKGGCSHWPAFHKWQSNEYLLSQMRDNQIKVSVTPDGYADAVKLMNDYRQKIFTFPLECEMPFNLFLTELQRQTLQSKRILYMQSQCDNLTGEQWRPLLDDLPLKSTGEMFGGWIVDCEQQQQQVFKQPPVARNIWIGREESVTSLHKDYYENMYAVLRGEKEFLLLPPDWEGVKCQEFPAYRYNNDLDLEPATATGNGDPPTIHWFPESDEILAGAFRIKVSAGDVLYLPSEYYHHVQQSGDICIAVNCWFECDL